MNTLARLRERLAALNDLGSLGRLAAWDQRTMMPPAGAPARASALATLETLAHDLATGDDVGAWLDELADADLDDLDRDVVRLARRDYARARRVPGELVAELAQAGAEGQAAWLEAREASEFALLEPALRRNVELARAYAACFDDEARPYDALLAD